MRVRVCVDLESGIWVGRVRLTTKGGALGETGSLLERVNKEEDDDEGEVCPFL